jgi:hypothetical protein
MSAHNMVDQYKSNLQWEYAAHSGQVRRIHIEPLTGRKASTPFATRKSLSAGSPRHLLERGFPSICHQFIPIFPNRYILNDCYQKLSVCDISSPQNKLSMLLHASPIEQNLA